MRMIKIFLWCLFLSPSLWAQQKIKDFRATNQTLALLGLATEFVDPSTYESMLGQIRKRLNRYSKTYGESSIQGFKLGNNPGGQFFKASESGPSDAQKNFLKQAAKDNSIDILVLGSFKQVGEDYALELQLFDNRIDVWSKVEKASFNLRDAAALDQIVYRIMNYLDKDGYVFSTPQDFLEPPVQAQTGKGGIISSKAQDEFSVNPSELSSGILAGRVSIGGEKTPFWERWWFWASVGGGLVLAGGLSYYFLVANRTPSSANLQFNIP